MWRWFMCNAFIGGQENCVITQKCFLSVVYPLFDLQTLANQFAQLSGW